MTSRETYQQAAIILTDGNRRELLEVLKYDRAIYGCSEQLWLIFSDKATSIASI
jgi:hypothetical protein